MYILQSLRQEQGKNMWTGGETVSGCKNTNKRNVCETHFSPTNGGVAERFKKPCLMGKQAATFRRVNQGLIASGRKCDQIGLLLK